MIVGPRQAVSPPSILGPLRNIYSPLLPLKEQLTISPLPKRYKEGMNITFNVPTDKNACTHPDRYIKTGAPEEKGGKKTHRYTDTYQV